MTIKEILESQTMGVLEKIGLLRRKSIELPVWGGIKGLVREYEPRLHPVMNKSEYPDIPTERGYTKVTRVTLNWQRLAVSRMTALTNGIPIKRVYKPMNDQQKEIAAYMESIFTKCRINTVNNERLTKLFASCEVMTLWYAVERENDDYGFHSSAKMRCRTFSPMDGDELYPLFDEWGDMVAMSVAYKRKVGKKTVSYFDTYTEDSHVKYSNESGRMEEVVNEPIAIGKIPAIYMYRPTPIWEDESCKVFETEWALSRNGNYLRENSRPILAVFADEEVNAGAQPTTAEETDPDVGGGFKDSYQLPKGSSMQYVTWTQATDNLKFFTEQMRSLFFTELQLPDWSYDKMSQQALSGESRKQLFIDAQLKVQSEAGRIVEAADREVNVIRAFLKGMLPEKYHKDIDALSVETQVTPFTINDEKDVIANLTAANGGLPIISQRESIEQLGWSDDVDKTLEEIAEQQKTDLMGLSE